MEWCRQHSGWGHLQLSLSRNTFTNTLKDMSPTWFKIFPSSQPSSILDNYYQKEAPSSSSLKLQPMGRRYWSLWASRVCADYENKQRSRVLMGLSCCNDIGFFLAQCGVAFLLAWEETLEGAAGGKWAGDLVTGLRSSVPCASLSGACICFPCVLSFVDKDTVLISNSPLLSRHLHFAILFKDLPPSYSSWTLQ